MMGQVMTRKTVPGKLQHHVAFAELEKHYSGEQIVEIAFTSGFFNFWNRFTDSFEMI